MYKCNLSQTPRRSISHVLRVAPPFRRAISPVRVLLAVLLVVALLLPSAADADLLAAQSRTGSVAASRRTFHRHPDRRISHTQQQQPVTPQACRQTGVPISLPVSNLRGRSCTPNSISWPRQPAPPHHRAKGFRPGLGRQNTHGGADKPAALM